jgi:putative hydrolase of the HAD superfamily
MARSVADPAGAGNGGVEAVIFDWGGTLTPWHTVDVAEQWQVYASHYARDHPDHPDGGAALAERMLEAEREAWLRIRGEGGSATLEELLAAVGVVTDHPGHAAAQVAYEEFWEPHTYTSPEVALVFEGLRARGIRVGVLSNTIWSREYHDGIFERDGVLDLIDGAVYSSEIAHAKPHPEAFRAAVAAVGSSDPSRCVYVGDRVFEDVHGAQRAGLRAVWVPHSDIPADQQVPVDVTPDGVAHRLVDVLDLVDGWAT